MEGLSNVTKKQILNYWSHRTLKYKERAVGYRPSEKLKFLFQYINTNYKTLDYGCGIGVCACKFINYLGVDIMEDLVKAAKEKNPSKDFAILSDLCLPEKIDFDFEQFFTATVLQHNPDDVVKDIFKSVSELKNKGVVFSLYENCQTNAQHMQARTSEDYVALLKNYFYIVSYVSYTHTIFNAEHCLTIIKT